jgi:hypothetical protein
MKDGWVVEEVEVEAAKEGLGFQHHCRHQTLSPWIRRTSHHHKRERVHWRVGQHDFDVLGFVLVSC